MSPSARRRGQIRPARGDETQAVLRAIRFMQLIGPVSEALSFADAETRYLNMAQDTTMGSSTRWAFPDLDMRLDADHRNTSINWKDMVLRYSETGEEVPYRVYSINNHCYGYRDLAFTIPCFSIEQCRAFASFVPQLRTELSHVEVVVPSDHDPSSSKTVSTNELPWSNRVFIYTDSTTASKSDILAIFRSIGLEAALIDNESWNHTLSANRPDVSSSHNNSDKENPSRSLADLTRGAPSIPILDDLQLRLQELEIDEIYAAINPLLIGASISTPILSSGTVLFRGRRFTRIFNKAQKITVRDLSYPPPSVTKIGRVNRPNQPFFYCSASQEVIYYEIPGLSTGDEFVLSYWRIRDPILVHNIGYTQFVFDQLGAKRPLPVWTGDWKRRRLEIPDEQSVREAEAHLLPHHENGRLQEALGNAFMSDVGDDKEYKYKLTVAISEAYLLKIVANQSQQFCGVLYPTVRMAANGDNLALKPECVDAHLEFLKAKHVKIDEKRGNSVTMTIVDFADAASPDGILQWKGRPPAFTLPPGDTGEFTLMEGRDEDGDYVISADGKVCHWVGEDQRGNVLKLG